MDTTIQLSGMSPAERDALFAQNVKLAEYIARRYGVDRLDHNDRRQAALIGLMQAARRWDPDRSEFKTYAGAVIRRVIDRVSNRERMLSMAMTDIDLLGDVLSAHDESPEQELLETEESVIFVYQKSSELIAQAPPRKYNREGRTWSPRVVLEMYAKGIRQVRIAEMLGVSRQRIGQIITDARKRAVEEEE